MQSISSQAASSSPSSATISISALSHFPGKRGGKRRTEVDPIGWFLSFCWSVIRVIALNWRNRKKRSGLKKGHLLLKPSMNLFGVDSCPGTLTEVCRINTQLLMSILTHPHNFFSISPGLASTHSAKHKACKTPQTQCSLSYGSLKDHFPCPQTTENAPKSLFFFPQSHEGTARRSLL